MSMALKKEFVKGLWRENPVFRLLLGMCPALAVTTSAVNGLAMGMAVIFVLVSSNVIISSFRKLIPHQVRIATFTVIIATFVTVCDYFLAAQFPKISKALGPYVPLIVVNCIILFRAEAFASRNSILPSLIDGLGMGLGFTLSLVLLGGIRELFGAGTIFNVSVVSSEILRPWVVMVLPAGAFITLGILIGIMNLLSGRRT